MSKEQQIEEMARDIDEFCQRELGTEFNDDILTNFAENLYAKGCRKQNEWISVEERLPEESGWYLVNIFVPFSLDFINLSHYSKVYGWNNPATVTHWMPLPEAPKMKGGEE